MNGNRIPDYDCKRACISYSDKLPKNDSMRLLSGELASIALLGRSKGSFKDDLTDRHTCSQGNRGRSVIENLKLQLTYKASVDCWSGDVDPYANPR